MRLLLSMLLAAFVLGSWAETASAQSGMPDEGTVYGWQLMTPQEQFQYRDRMRQARTYEERARLRQQHYDDMQNRARQRGVALAPPPSQYQPGMAPRGRGGSEPGDGAWGGGGYSGGGNRGGGGGFGGGRGGR